MFNDIDDVEMESEWTTIRNVKNKQKKNNKPVKPFYKTSDRSNVAIGGVDKFVSKKGNISLWMLYIIDDDIEFLINERLKLSNKIPDGKIDSLWNCLFNEYRKNIDATSEYENSNNLRDAIYLLDNKKHKHADFDHFAMENFSKKYNLQLIFLSIDTTLKDIVYGKNLLKSFQFLHIGMDLFLELKSDKITHDYKFPKDEKILITNAITIEKVKCENQEKLNYEVEKLNEIKEKLIGLQVSDSYDHGKIHGKQLHYDLYTQEQLDEMNDLILCKLKMENPHAGKAIPIENLPGMKFREIKLKSRRNCGYNTFENDLVYVKINDVKNYTGKVIYVHQSNHKPVNNIYICKVNKDQGSLMTPLNKSFPKIHVDNEPGRRYYEGNLKKRKPNQITPQQKSVVDRERESAKYADNLYYSLYDIQVNKSSNKIETINPRVIQFNPDTCDYLFIVLYEKWDPHFMYPCGKVVGTLSTRDSFVNNLHIITSICNIDKLDITKQYEKEIKIIQKKYDNNITNKYLPSDALVFTIDNETTVDMDDAISYHKEKDDIIIGIHISDVTKYVSPNSEIYKQAKNRYCTSYPPKFSNKSPIQIFDKRLSTDFLSLIPNQRRSVVSVYFRFTQEMQNRDFKLSDIIQPIFGEDVIMSQYKLNYDDVSSWLRQTSVPEDVNKDLISALGDIFKITTKLRRARLPESYFVKVLNEYYQDFSIRKSFEGQLLIEELMLLANEYVAKKIYEKYPDSTLLRMQDPVIYHEEWTEKLFQSTNMNFAGQLKDYCKLINVNINNMNPNKKLVVSRKFFDKFEEFVNNDKDKAKYLLQHDVYINEFYVHIKEWYGISNPAFYNCSIKDCVNMGHFSLNKPLYTHFTSPIRRFTDVVVHRLLKFVLSGKEIPDDSLEINEVCAIANTRSERNKTFEKMCAPYSIFNETNKRYCFILDCVCSEISDEEISFIHPILQKASSCKSIKFACLSLDDIPVASSNKQIIDNCILKWRKIIFSCPPHLNSSQNSGCNKFIIDNHLFDSYLPPTAWKLFREIRRSYQSGENLTDELKSLRSEFVSKEYTNIISSDSFSFVDPIIDIELNIFIKNTMRIQFCKYNLNGLSQICPELFIITPTFHICLIHQNDPTKYFIPGGKLNIKHDDIKKTFDSIEDYQSYFEPLIEAESLVEALSENCAFTLEKVPIKWIVSVSPRTKCKQRYGVIIISNEFCKSRNNIFDDDKSSIINRCEYLIAKGISSVGEDLICLRHIKENWNNYWVGHGHVVHIEKCKLDNTIMTVVIFRLTQSDFDIFPKSNDRDLFTLDLYPKSVVSIRQQSIMGSIDKYDLLKEIILGTQVFIKEIDNLMILKIENEIRSCGFLNFNAKQRKSVEMALHQKLSLIWGPPGTGKTTVGCYLSFGYTFRNKILLELGQMDKKGVVLYCGPSNDSVNLVAVQMRERFKDKCLNLLRIFGEQQELSDFPLPGYFSKNDKLTQEIQEFSLHFLIRQHGERANQLKSYDEMFKKILIEKKCLNGENIHDLIVEYKDLIKEAKKEYIMKYHFDMVLCTTSVTATVIMKMFNFTQVIIDEAGMCKEPETLIPIGVTEETVRNVVLIGDHKQLRPIIKNKFAKKRGLEISLFERYQELRPNLVTMLDCQYRMHPSICEFPSNQFYNGNLKTQISDLWTGLKPDHMFVKDVKKPKSINKEKKEIFHRIWNGIDYRMAVKEYHEYLNQSNYNAIPNEKWPGKRKKSYRCFDKKFNCYPERVIFIHVIGDEINQSVTTKTGNENSKGNNEEVEVAGYIYEKIIKNCSIPRRSPEQVTVLTQYKLQKDLLEKKCLEILKKLKIIINPIVKTVIRSQGSENDYVIFSTVRSIRNKEDINYNPTPGWERQYLGFITDPNQVNVALTRAKKGLIIIGNKNLLGVNNIWQRLILDFQARGCVIENYLDFL